MINLKNSTNALFPHFEMKKDIPLYNSSIPIFTHEQKQN